MAQPRRILRWPRGNITFLTRKWARELDYRLEENLWCFTENRIAVLFEYESHEEGGQWWRSNPYDRLATPSRPPSAGSSRSGAVEAVLQ